MNSAARQIYFTPALLASNASAISILEGIAISASLDSLSRSLALAALQALFFASALSN